MPERDADLLFVAGEPGGCDDERAELDCQIVLAWLELPAEAVYFGLDQLDGEGFEAGGYFLVLGEDGADVSEG